MSAGAKAIQSGKAELVVRLSFLIVGENLVRFSGFLEAFFSGFVAGVSIGMILDSQPSVSSLDLVLGCGL